MSDFSDCMTATRVTGFNTGSMTGAMDGGFVAFASPPSARVGANAGVEADAYTFPLVFCPEMPCGTRYELIRKNADGALTVMYCGVLTDPAPSLNLAKVRHRGARLGASEVVLVPPDAGVEFVSLAQ